MSILILNAGSSSLKAKLFDQNLKEIKSFKIERIKSDGSKNHTEATKEILTKIDLEKIKIIGHRVVHGGDKFVAPTEITDEVITEIEKLSNLAPLHNPPALEVIKETQKSLDRLGTRQFAVFDTAFFRDLPKEAKYYPLPYEYYKKGIKKYGFHGISHQYAIEEALEEHSYRPASLASPRDSASKGNLITIHLGAGCSITAIEKGQPIETSMGFTPNDGLMMMTRTGGIDPSIVLFMMRQMNLSPEKIENILEKQSGLLGISGVSDDMRDILFVAGIKVEDKDYVMPSNIQCDREHIKRSELAIKLFCRTVKKFIGGYIALLNNKVDALVFTGEIGYGSSILREKIAKDFGIKIIAIKPNEELAIARGIIKLND